MKGWGLLLSQSQLNFVLKHFSQYFFPHGISVSVTDRTEVLWPTPPAASHPGTFAPWGVSPRLVHGETGLRQLAQVHTAGRQQGEDQNLHLPDNRTRTWGPGRLTMPGSGTQAGVTWPEEDGPHVACLIPSLSPRSVLHSYPSTSESVSRIEVPGLCESMALRRRIRLDGQSSCYSDGYVFIHKLQFFMQCYVLSWEWVQVPWFLCGFCGYEIQASPCRMPWSFAKRSLAVSPFPGGTSAQCRPHAPLGCIF